MEIKCRDLLLEEHCEKLFCLMDSFWEEIAGANVDLNWLIKVRSHLDKIEKEQEKVKRKKLSSLSRNSSLQKIVFDLSNSNQTFFFCIVILSSSKKCSDLLQPISTALK